MIPIAFALLLPLQDDGRAPRNTSPTNQDLWLSFNNTTTAARTRDGAVVLLYQQKGTVFVRRAKEGRTSEKKLGTGRGLVALGGDGDATMLALWLNGQEISASWSHDGGLTFEEGKRIARGNAPAVRVWRSDGTLRAMIAYHVGEKQRAEVWSLAYVGEAWETPQRMDSGGAGSFVSLSGRGDACVAAWKDFRKGGRLPELYLADYSGGKWSGERPAGFSGADPCVVLDAAGRYHLGYQGVNDVFYTTSKDGRSWERPVKIGAGLFIHVAVNARGQTAVTWEKFLRRGSHLDDTIKAVGFAFLTDGGGTFRAEKVENDKPKQIRAHLSLGEDGSVSLFYVDRTESEGKLVWRDTAVR